MATASYAKTIMQIAAQRRLSTSMTTMAMGRITCAEAEHHGIAPVPRNHPAYPCMQDGDGDGVVCE